MLKRILIKIVVLFVCLSCTADETGLVSASQYTKFNWLQGKPQMLRQSDFILILDRKADDTYSIDIVNISDVNSPSFAGTLVNSESSSRIFDFAVSSDDERLFVLTANAIQVYNVENVQEVKLLTSVKVSGADSLVLSTSTSTLLVNGCVRDAYCAGMAQFEATDSLKLLRQFELPSLSELHLSMDGRTLSFVMTETNALVLARFDTEMQLEILAQDSETFNNRGSWKTSGSVEDMTFSEDGKFLFVAANELGLIVYNIAQGELEKTQQTAGSHWWSFFNSTESVYGVDLIDDHLFLAGVSAEPAKNISAIKGVSSTTLLSGEFVSVFNAKNLILTVNSRNESYGLTISKLTK